MIFLIGCSLWVMNFLDCFVSVLLCSLIVSCVSEVISSVLFYILMRFLRGGCLCLVLWVDGCLWVIL